MTQVEVLEEVDKVRVTRERVVVRAKHYDVVDISSVSLRKGTYPIRGPVYLVLVALALYLCSGGVLVWAAWGAGACAVVVAFMAKTPWIVCLVTEGGTIDIYESTQKIYARRVASAIKQAMEMQGREEFSPAPG